MTLVGCDLHSRKQQVAVLDTTTGEILEQELVHEGGAVERFYRALRPPVTIGIETTGYTQWFYTLMQRLGHTVIVGEAAKIRAMQEIIAAFDEAEVECHVLTFDEARFLQPLANGRQLHGL